VAFGFARRATRNSRPAVSLLGLVRTRPNLRLPAATHRVARAIAARAWAVGRRLFSRCQTAQSSSFPRRVVAPGFLLDVRVHPRSRGGRSADRRTCSVVARVKRDLSAPSGVRRVPWRGTLASRRSTVAIFGRGPRFHLRHCLQDPCSELLAARSSCLAGGVPDLPSPRLRAAAAGRHSPLHRQDRLRKTPPPSEDALVLPQLRVV